MSKEYPIPLSALHTLQHTTPEHEGKTHTFIVEIPTQLMKERLSLRLYELGIVPTSPATVRAAMVNELYEIMPEEKADEAAEFLHAHWEAQDAELAAHLAWSRREVQRIQDTNAGAPPREPEEEPKSKIPVRNTYRSQGLADMLNDQSPRYRQMQSRRATWEQDNARMMLRVAIVGCRTIDIERKDEVLTAESLEAIMAAVGKDGVQSLIKFVNAQYGLSEEEKENSDSPGENAPDQTGSTGGSGVSDGSDGSSTSTTRKGSPTGRRRGAGSGKITGKSSGTSSDTTGATSKSGQTVAAG